MTKFIMSSTTRGKIVVSIDTKAHKRMSGSILSKNHSDNITVREEEDMAFGSLEMLLGEDSKRRKKFFSY